MLLRTVSIHEKGGVLEGPEICRILPADDSGSAVKNQDLSTRPRFLASATCGFVCKNRVCTEVSDFPRTSKIRDKKIRSPEAKTPQHPVVADT